MFVMEMFVLVFVLAVLINDAASMTHSLLYFDTSSTQVPNFPQFVAVGYVNGLQVTRYDSNTRKYEPKQEWMKNITDEDAQYWDTQTQIYLGLEQLYKGNTEIAKQRFNLTDGLHMLQRMYGCEWDDETNEINGYSQYAFDGEDFIAFDLKTETFVAPRAEAVVTKHKWEKDGFSVPRNKDYIMVECVEYLKKHLRNGESVLMRKELPRLSFLQKSPSSPVTCHATGFYPDRAMLFWTKDGDELIEGLDESVSYWEILPNHDGTFQKSADLDLTSVPPEDWDRYECVFQLSGVADINTRLDRTKIRSNAKKQSTAYISLVLAALGLLTVAGIVAFFLIRKRKARKDVQAKQRLNTDSQEPAASDPSESAEDADVGEKLNPDGE